MVVVVLSNLPLISLCLIATIQYHEYSLIGIHLHKHINLMLPSIRQRVLMSNLRWAKKKEKRKC